MVGGIFDEVGLFLGGKGDISLRLIIYYSEYHVDFIGGEEGIG